LDAFTKSHGLEAQDGFLKNHLGLALEVKQGFFNKFCSSVDDIAVTLELQYPTVRPAESLCILKFGPGKKEQERALIGDIRVRSSKTLRPAIQDMMDWMDEAHGHLHDVFEFITSNKLKNLMGPKRRIQRNDA
jgi:hypothetical protein